MAFMQNYIIDLIPFILSGALVGLFVGLTGVGGGSLMTPLLTIVFGVAPTSAVGTDLAFAAITKGVGTFAHRLHAQVNWTIVKLLCLGSLPSAILTILILKLVGPLGGGWPEFFKTAIGVSVLLTVVSLVFRAKLLRWIEANPKFQLKGKPLQVATIFIGFFIGILVTISSIGAGAVGATFILFLYPHLKPAQVAGTDIAYAVPLTGIAGIGHWWLGNVDFLLLIGLLIGSMPAIWMGAKLANRLPEKHLRVVLASVLTLVGFKLVF